MSRRLAVMLFLLISSMVLAACGQQQITAEEITQRMEQARADLQDAHATVAFDFTNNDGNETMVVEGWVQKTDQTDAEGKPINRTRAEVLQASDEKMVGSTVVSNGETFWFYNPSENTVVTGNADEMGDNSASSPLGATQTLQDLVQRGLDAVDLKVLGEEQVAGRNAWKVEVTPNTDTEQELQLDTVIDATMWVDEEQALPLKLAVDASDFGNFNVEVQSLDVNKGVDSAIFDYTPPVGAEVVNAADLAAQMQPRAATIDEARTAVSFTLLEPTVFPNDAALVEVRVIGTQTVILNYGAGDTTFSLVQSNENVGGDRSAPAGSAEETVTVRGQEATLITGGDGQQGSLLRWEENGVRIVIAGSISGDEAVVIANSLQ